VSVSRCKGLLFGPMHGGFLSKGLCLLFVTLHPQCCGALRIACCCARKVMCQNLGFFAIIVF